MLKVVIAENGEVKEVTPISGDPFLAQAWADRKRCVFLGASSRCPPPVHGGKSAVALITSRATQDIFRIRSVSPRIQ